MYILINGVFFQTEKAVNTKMSIYFYSEQNPVDRFFQFLEETFKWHFVEETECNLHSLQFENTIIFWRYFKARFWNVGDYIVMKEYLWVIENNCNVVV